MVLQIWLKKSYMVVLNDMCIRGLSRQVYNKYRTSLLTFSFSVTSTDPFESTSRSFLFQNPHNFKNRDDATYDIIPLHFTTCSKAHFVSYVNYGVTNWSKRQTYTYPEINTVRQWLIMLWSSIEHHAEASSYIKHCVIQMNHSYGKIQGTFFYDCPSLMHGKGKIIVYKQHDDVRVQARFPHHWYFVGWISGAVIRGFLS